MKTKLKDNTIFRWIIIPLCMALCFFGQFIPGNEALSSEAIGVLFIFLGTLILWLTIGIDWPSLLCMLSLGFIKSFGFNKVLTSGFGNVTFAFLLFTFVCTYALSKTTLIRRVAITFVNSKLAKVNGYFFIFLFLLAVLLLGLFISPSVLFIIMLPILNEILEISGIDKKDKIAKVLMIGLGFTVSISSGMTPIAHVFPVLAINAANLNISTFAYMGLAVPAGFILFLLMYLILIIFIRPDVNKIKYDNMNKLKDELPKLDKRDIYTLVIFIIVLLLWIVPSLFEYISPEFYKTFNNFGTSMPPLLGVLALCVIRVNKEPLIKVDDAFKNGVPWSSLIMCAATLTLGAALQNEDIGITLFLENYLGPTLNNLSAIILLIIFALWAALQTNLSSNMVTATLVATVASTILTSATTSLNIEATICIIGMLASFAFATPPSMPHIAIICSDESTSTKDVLLYGSIMMILSVIVSLLIAYPIGTLIF